MTGVGPGLSGGNVSEILQLDRWALTNHSVARPKHARNKPRLASRFEQVRRIAVTNNPNSGGDAPRKSVKWPARWTAAAAALLVPVALVMLKPADAPPATAPVPPALPTAPAPQDPEPARTAIQPGESAPIAPRQAAEASLPVAVDPNEEQTLYLTIVGDKIHRVMGPVSGRPPRIDELPALASAELGAPVDTPGSVSDPPGVDVVVAELEQVAPSLAPGERPLGPAPQECPRTLPPGSDQATADGLRRQSGCRYLSSCTVDTNECTFFYQGRG